MAYNITGSISEASRIIVLNESDMAIESNTTHSGGAFDVTANDDNDKIIIARKNDGESFGYGAITPIMTGPPTGDDFSGGLDNWTQIYTNESDITIDTSNNELETTIVDSANTESHVDHVFNYKISGDFDIEVDVSGSGAMSSSQLYLAYLSVGIQGDSENNRVEIRRQWDATRRVRVYNVTNGSYPLMYDGTTGVDSCTLRITRTGTSFSFYHNTVAVSTFSRDLGSAPLEIVVKNWRYGNTTAVLTTDNFKVNSGTLTY